MADGLSFEIDVNTKAGSADTAASQILNLSAQLERATSAADAAKQALNAAESAYKKIEGQANSAAAKVEELNGKLAVQKTKLDAASAAGDSTKAAALQKDIDKLTDSLGDAERAQARFNSQMKAQAATVDKLQAEYKEADEAVKKLKGAEDQAAAAAGSGKVNEMGEAFGKLGGPLGSVGQKIFGAAEGFKKMGASLGSAGPYVAIAVALVAVAAGVAAVSAAAVVGVAKITAWAVGLADAARTQRLLADGVAGSVAIGEELNATLNLLANRAVPMSRDELLGMAADLKKAGFEGRALSTELEKAAIKAATAKFGTDFTKQLNSLPVLAERLKANIAGVFGGLRIEKLLAGLSKLVALFDSTSDTGKAIKVLFESLFQPLVDGIVGFIPKLVSGFIQFEIMVMKAMIAVKPLGSTIATVAKYAGMLALVVGGALAVGITAWIAGFTLLAAGCAVVIGAVVGLVAGIFYAGQVFADFGASIFSSIGAAFEWLSSLSLAEIGAMLIDGLVNGITSGAQAVIGAITGVANGAINAAKSALGIASPSKVFAEIGGFTAEGMSEGVDEGGADVQQSLEAMVAPPPAAGAPAPAATPAASGGNIYQVTINAPDGDGASIRQSFADWFESIGAQPAPAG